LGFGGIVLEASGLYLYSLERIGNMNTTICQNLGLVEDVLAELISPTQQEFRVADLERDYGYPTVDLFDVDMDWI